MDRIEAIAFDLDMTLVDSRSVSRRALERLACECGAQLDVDALMSTYGLPLSRWLGPNVDAPLFRALQAQDMHLATSMTGAQAALDAVRELGARAVVVTSAPIATATAMLEASELRVDRIRSGVWGSEKVVPIREENCWAFVGDHTDDMLAARRAGVIAVGVNSGTTPPLGAQIELDDLGAFPAWLAHQSTAR